MTYDHSAEPQGSARLELPLAAAPAEASPATPPGESALLPAWYASLIERNPDPIFCVDRTGRFRAVNPACAALSGYSPEELLAMDWRQLCAPEEFNRTQQSFLHGIAGETTEVETVLVRRDGARIDLLLTGGPVVENGAVAGIFVIGKDITQKKADARALAASREQLEREVDERTADLRLSNAFLGEQVAQRQAAEESLRRANDVLEVRVARRTAEAEARARAAEEGRRTLEALLQHAPEGILIADLVNGEIRIRNISHLGARMLGGSPESLTEQTSREFILRRYALLRQDGTAATPEEWPLTRAIFRGEDVQNEEWTVRRPDGTRMPSLVNAGPIRDASGAVIGGVLTFRDITHLQMARDAALADARLIEAARAELERANNAKDEFLASLSHELRTPLTPVLLGARDLEKHVPDELKPEVAMIRRNVELLTRLVDDLLDLTRIGHGRLHLQRESVDVHAAIDSAIGIIAADARAKRVHIERELLATDTTADADSARLRQAIWNLLANAIKFTPSGGRVTVRTRTGEPHDGRPRSIIIEVLDNGIGIAPGALKRIFGVFEQGDPGVSRRFGGLGLGLAITRSIVELHGGSIEAESRGPGQGSIFRLTLPVVRGVVPAVPADTAIDAPATHRSLRILLVEDHRDTSRVLRRLLETAGHTVESVSSVAQLANLGDARFDLLISDIGLPDGSGLDVIERMRPRVGRAIALSGFGMAEDIARSRAAGFHAHLIKPVNFECLEAIIRETARAD